jgi:hypothetical protein
LRRLAITRPENKLRPAVVSAFRIILINAVKYVTNVESYDRRIQSAINIQGKRMLRRAEFLLTHALRQAGWKE